MPTHKKGFASILLALLVLLVVGLGITVFFVTSKNSKQAPTSFTSENKTTENLTQSDFSSGIRYVYSFSDSKNKDRKFVEYSKNNILTEASTLYITEPNIDIKTAKKVVDFETNDGLTFHEILTKADGKLFLIHVSFPENGEYYLVNETGKVIQSEILSNSIKSFPKDDLSKLGGFGITYQDPSTFDAITFKILNGDDTNWIFKVDALTGKYIEGSLQQVK